MGEVRFGATRVADSSSLAARLRDSPDTGQLLSRGHAPILFAYGGEDSIHTGHTGMKHAGHLPTQIQTIVEQIEEDGRDVFTYVLPGADHGFNETTGIDDDFNGGPRYQSIRTVMQNFFHEYGGR